MLPARDAVPQLTPSPRELDDLDLLVAGVMAPLTGFGEPSTGVTLRVPAEVARQAVATGALELVDPEGAPLATVSVDSTYDGGSPFVGIVGPVRGLGRRVGRVLDHLYLSPEETRAGGDGPDTVVAPCERPLTQLDVAAIADRAAGRPVVLLALTGEGRPDGVSAVGLLRASLAASTLVPGSRVVAVPLARREDVARDRELRSRVVAAYAGGEVVEPRGEGPLPEAVAAAVRSDRPSGTAQGLVVLFTGLSGSGKSTVARGLRDALVEHGHRTVSLLDGDVVRRNLSAGLTFSREDRETNIRRIGWVAAEISGHGGTAICSPIAPFATTRAAVRTMVEAAGGAFVLVHVATPLAECERRDRKGLYAKARRGDIPDFTGISSPYEEPQDADLRADTTGRPVEEVVQEVLDLLRARGLVGPRAPRAARDVQ